jgi:UDP-N-acetylmuramoyl-L-alanyl-D-glutamate--2,6-diaminopimelate ligase
MLFEMYDQGQTACVLEVSSHALALERASGLQFEAAVFTNLSRDHLDFHNDEEDYFLTKAKLFSLLEDNGTAVINTDDPFGKRLKGMIDKSVISFGFDSGADIHPIDWQMDMSGTNIKLRTSNGNLEIRSKLISEFNIQNIMAAVGVGLAFGLPLSSIKSGVEDVHFVPGRLQAVDVQQDTVAFIDYSHTPDSLEKAIKTLRQVVKNRLIVVFGCGGDRDKGKRPIMGQIAETHADFVIVTTDNPRTEDPKAIIDDILAGMHKSEKMKVIIDRHEAIIESVKMSVPGDIILIAGKGHESYQEINGVKYEFDEVAMVQEAAGNV